MRCSLPPHKEPLAFRTYPEYEAHYHSFHLNRCIECRKNFPSNHLLGVHIEECHDPLVRVKREQGERTFSCFVEGCDRKCSTHQKRRMHLIDKHMYPKNYFFGVTKDGIDGRRSLINDGGHRRRRSSAASQTGAKTRPNETQSAASKNSLKPQDLPEEESTEKMSIDPEVEDITGAMSALNFVPPSVRFGRGRAGFAKS
ncbi:hypothetical protein VHEMI05118 [[Torrubiella] hemipterigena]|uniref:C2H2-type domain-containing protein n=1 Tax=[Torrubiella] hemipterigena TaxID=1531966 RepID=A0A0A1TFW5_9HYPO|nr:hypothetical protein VHEMI05118 [[Torrubiella] hemipterigena]